MFRILVTLPALLWGLFLSLSLVAIAQPAEAADAYVLRYLAREPVALKGDDQGQTRLFSVDDLSQGKQLFLQHCLNCHVGGSTLPNPLVSLTLKDLQGATPPRNNINALVAFSRNPRTYDGTEAADTCRVVPENWLSQLELENLAAFVLRAAEKAPGWGGQL
jgi:photosystem II cytochrome c550